MNHSPIPSARRAVLAAVLVVGVAAVQAAAGHLVRHDQESLITPGMSTAEVEQALGRPDRLVKFGNEPGPTWTYRLIDNEETLFDVDFGADGKVVSANERVEETD